MIIHQHLSFPGQLNQAGFHTTFHKMLSVARRELARGFFTGAGGSNSARFTIHTKKLGWGIEDNPGSLYGHDSKSTVGLLLLFCTGNVLGAGSQS